MADRYWVGGTGTWDGTNTANWSASSGGASGASIPTASDNVFFDANSNTGTGAFTVTLATTTANCLNFDTTGVDGAMTLARSGTIRLHVYGSFTVTSNFTMATTTAQTRFYHTSGVNIITTNGVVMDCPFAFLTAGGSWQLQDNFTTTSTQSVTLTDGTLNLNGKILTTGIFNSSNANARTLAFGTGKIVLTGSGTFWNITATTNLTITGTPVVDANYAGAVACTLAHYATLEAQAISFNITAGTYTLTISTSYFIDFDLTGFAGVLTTSGTSLIYGNLTLSSGMTTGSSIGILTFAATSGTKTITTNGRTLSFPVTFNGVGGTWQLQDALTLSSVRALTLTNGTFNANNFNVTVGTFALGAGTKTLTLGSGTWTILGSGSSAWNANTNVTGLTVSASTGIISMNSASAKTFAGGAQTWPTLNQGGAGVLTVQQSNTFANITNTVQPATIRFTAGTTQTVSAFGVSGTSGNLITLDTTVAGSRATLSDASGTVDVSFVSIKDIAATGGATWNAFTSNGNVDAGNNTGWNFTVVPSAGNKYIYNVRKSKRVIS